MNLQGASILITGGRRVGGKLAVELAQRGASVALTYRSSRDAIAATVAEVQRRGGRGLAIEADLTHADEAAAAVDAAVTRFGRLDALINMASVFQRTPFETLRPDHFDTLIASNLAAPYHTAIAAARRMLNQPADDAGMHGKIVNIGDWAADRPYRDYLPYLVAKGGLKTFTLALAAELAPRIAVNMIQPAMIEPPADLSADEIAEVIAKTPLARVGRPEDVNNLILYLLTGTDFVTGACFRVDGGRFLGCDD